MYVHIPYSATPTHAHTRIAVNTIYEVWLLTSTPVLSLADRARSLQTAHTPHTGCPRGPTLQRLNSSADVRPPLLFFLLSPFIRSRMNECTQT